MSARVPGPNGRAGHAFAQVIPEIGRRVPEVADNVFINTALVVDSDFPVAPAKIGAAHRFGPGELGPAVNGVQPPRRPIRPIAERAFSRIRR